MKVYNDLVSYHYGAFLCLYPDVTMGSFKEYVRFSHFFTLTGTPERCIAFVAKGWQ